MQNCFNYFKIYIIHKRIGKLWSRDTSDIRVLAHFQLKTDKELIYQNIVNIFKYVVLEIWLKKSDKKNIWTNHKDFWTISSVKMTRFLQRFQVAKGPNTSILYTWKALLSKNRFNFFTSTSHMHKFHHLLGCYPIGINSSLIFFKVLCIF